MKRVLVTGGARGIGRAIVEELASNGYEIIATYYESKEAAASISANNPTVNFHQVNFKDRQELD